MVLHDDEAKLEARVKGESCDMGMAAMAQNPKGPFCMTDPWDERYI